MMVVGKTVAAGVRDAASLGSENISGGRENIFGVRDAAFGVRKMISLTPETHYLT